MEAKVSRIQAYRHRNSDPQFAAEWADAIEGAADALEKEVRRRAFAGSDLLARFLLKKMRPEFRERITISSRELDQQIEKELAALRENGEPVAPLRLESVSRTRSKCPSRHILSNKPCL